MPVGQPGQGNGSNLGNAINQLLETNGNESPAPRVVAVEFPVSPLYLYSPLRLFATLMVLLTAMLVMVVLPTQSTQLRDTIAVLAGGTTTPGAPLPTFSFTYPATSVGSISYLGGYFLPASQAYMLNYPASAGIANGSTAPTYDQSVTIGANNTVTEVQQLRAADPTATIVVGGASQGADAVSRAITQLEGSGYDTSNINFILMGDVDRSNGGIFNRLPGGYVPGVGLTLGTTTTQSQYSHVTQVSNQYDLASDSPAYAFNIAAWMNALFGFVSGRHDYTNVNVNDPNAIVTTNASGTIKDVLVPEPEGQLPIFLPLQAAGVNSSVLWALDPFVRAIIETGYNRPDPSVPGSYPNQAQIVQILPPPSKWGPDMVSVAYGMQETLQRLASLAPTPQDALSQLQTAIINSPATIQTQAQSAVSSLQRDLQQVAALVPPPHTAVALAQSAVIQAQSVASNLQQQAQQLQTVVESENAVAKATLAGSVTQIETQATDLLKQAQQLATSAPTNNAVSQAQESVTQAQSDVLEATQQLQVEMASAGKTFTQQSQAVIAGSLTQLTIAVNALQLKLQQLGLALPPAPAFLIAALPPLPPPPPNPLVTIGNSIQQFFHGFGF